ncbi:MAG: TIGR04053 family radical SAM/SPASM domain-containing protein [Polyangiales bacterium]
MMSIDPSVALRARGATLDFDNHPLLAIWEVTQACDLACEHCRACATPGRDDGELSTGEGARVLDAIADMGTPVVVLTGGDPAKRDDLEALIRHGVSRGLTMTVTPSGTPLMTNERVRSLHAAGASRLAVSLDGPDAETHDTFRGVPGSFAESLRILRTAHAAGIATQVNTSIGPHNFKALRAMAVLVASLEVSLWAVFVVVPTGRAGASLLLTASRVEALLEELHDISVTAPFDVKTTAAPHYRRISMQRRDPGGAKGLLRDVGADGVIHGMRGITDGVGFLFVSHTGEIYPSGFLPLSAGNVRRDDLAEVYRAHPLFTQLRDADALGGKCGKCPFRRVCGGSRARAWAMRGDVMAEDPLCAYVPRGASA